jgi:hypothetical protein
MSRRHRFRPTGLDSLESRVVLSHGGRVIPAQVADLQSSRSPRSRIPLRIADSINNSFDSFTDDYLEAQRVYLAASTTTGAADAFRDFTRQRGSLLAQELARTIGRFSGALAKLPASKRSANIDTPLQAFLSARIIGGPNALVATLNQSVPSAGTTGPASTLFTLTATNAIDAARANTFNAVGFLLTGRFTPKHDK